MGVIAVAVAVVEHGQTLLLVLFKLVDALGYRLPIVRTELPERKECRLVIVWTYEADCRLPIEVIPTLGMEQRNKQSLPEQSIKTRFKKELQYSLGSIDQVHRPARCRRLATALIYATTANTIANTTATVANVVGDDAGATAAAATRNLGVGADGKQPIIATTRSDRIALVAAVAVGAPRPIRGCQRSVGRRPVLIPEIFAHR